MIAGLLAAVAAACTLGAIAGPIPTGTWGGKQGNLVVYADSATLDLPCAAGRIPRPLVADSAGRFDLDGFWAPMVGPLSINGPLWQPARFTGLRTDDHIEMTVKLATGSSIGPLVFERGVVGQFPRCV
jgi:hypothetical protein